MTELERLIGAISFYEIAREESKRLILCEPHREHQIRAAIDQAGVAGTLKVRASAACPEGKILVVDEGAFEAQQQEWLQGLRRAPLFPGGRP